MLAVYIALGLVSITSTFIATAAASAASGATTSVGTVGIASDTWEKALLTLLGTFIGASLAFFSQIALQKKQERKSDLLAAHRILFCLLQQSNIIVLYQKDWVATRATSRAQFIEIPAASEFDLERNLFDFDSFGFLLKTSEGRQIMYDLYLAQETYIETLRMINERSRMHRELLQPKMVEAGLGTGKEATLAEMQNLLGPLVHGTMVNATNQMLSLLQGTFRKLVAAKVAFRAYAVKYFKTTDFTNFDFPETYGLSAQDDV